MERSKALMAVCLESMQAQVLGLAKADRPRVRERLIASLDVDPLAEAAWAKLADDRNAELTSGRVAPGPIADAVARLRAKSCG